MRKYLYQRLLLAIPTLFGVTALIFIAMRVLPGDPLMAIYGESEGLHILTEEELEKRRLAVEKSWGYMRVDREIVEAMLREPSNLDV